MVPRAEFRAAAGDHDQHVWAVKTTVRRPTIRAADAGDQLSREHQAAARGTR